MANYEYTMACASSEYVYARVPRMKRLIDDYVLWGDGIDILHKR